MTLIESRSPQQPGDVVATAPAANQRGVESLVTAARSAAQEWALSPATTRADCLSAAAASVEAAEAELSMLVVREVGKPIAEARGEVARGVRILRYQAQAALDPDGETFPSAPPATASSLIMARRRPRGVAGLITPWNFPIAIPLWKASPALACGNAVVLKPSSEAIGVALRLQELLSPHLPSGLFAIACGEAETARALIAHVDVVSFTGSTAVGRQVLLAAAERGIPSQSEMGGSNASIVFPDADVAAAVQMIANAAMGYAGQKCTATSRVIVIGDPGPVTEALVEAIRQLPVGDPADADTVVGPVISASARDRVLSASAEAALHSGTVLTGGDNKATDGWWVTPTLVSGQTADAYLAREEVFGPIATVLHADSADHAVQIANASQYGLVTSVFTNDLEAAFAAVAQLDSGMVRVNLPTSGVDFHVPFGGEKGSSFGPREQGKAARELYTSIHTITIG